MFYFLMLKKYFSITARVPLKYYYINYEINSETINNNFQFH